MLPRILKNRAYQKLKHVIDKYSEALDKFSGKKVVSNGVKEFEIQMQ